MIRPFIIRLLKLRVWLVEHLQPSELQVTLVWAGMIGFMGAGASILFRKGIRGMQWLMTHQDGSLVEIASSLPLWQRLVIPIVGGLCAGLILHFGLKLIKGKSSSDYMEAVSLGNGVVRSRSTLIKSLSSLFTIASGGSIGREGSMVQLSAMLASLLGRKIHISTQRLRLLVACGAAAGIASAYNAPIAGALFVAEIIMGTIAMESFGPLVFSSVVATVTLHRFWDASPTYEIPSFHVVTNFELPLHIVLGLICGVIAPPFLRLFDYSEKMFSKIPAPLYAKLMIGGALVGAISVYRPEVWGNGYSVVSSILQTNWEWNILLVLLVFKILATAATVGSGAVGGVFTPTLFVGAVIGCLAGQGVQAIWPETTSHSSVYALVGMGSFLAATTHAPLMAIIMLFEMTLDYQMVLPLMLACVTAYYTSKGILKDSIYSDSLRRQENEYSPYLFKPWHVSDLLKPNPSCVDQKSSFGEIAGIFVKHRFNYLYVVDEESRFRGAISLHDLKPFLNDKNLASVVIAMDLVKEDFPTLTPEVPLSEALQKFLIHKSERLPVVDNVEDKRLLGTISKTDLLLAIAHHSQSSP